MWLLRSPRLLSIRRIAGLSVFAISGSLVYSAYSKVKTKYFSPFESLRKCLKGKMIMSSEGAVIFVGQADGLKSCWQFAHSGWVLGVKSKFIFIIWV